MRSAPGTHAWLLIILATSLVIAFSSQGLEQYLLHRTSSNLHELDRHPVQSLLLSAFWIENPASLPTYVLLFEIVHARVERGIGTARWLLVVTTAHIAATLVSQKVVLVRIENHDASRRMLHVVDIGVSYGLAASAGVLTYLVPGRWKWLYAAALTAFFAVPLATGGTFTDLGHAIALAVGFAAWPLTRGRRAWATVRAYGK
ncbi:rhomboid-like protein [Streptomyces boluensis]|uniref:rhomboid-like protein n=1 Tax=Streptomyces boluensis TaxID=1775135 RepID=UPI0028A95316|nr:rhomboid-like protein [Streptomyces boluensis]